MARHKHGWVKLETDTILLGLDSYQFHYYHLARALAAPPQAQDPQVLGITNGMMATLMGCSRHTVVRLKAELLSMGLLAERAGQLYVLNPPTETLHNHNLVLAEIAEFLKNNGGLFEPLNTRTRRTGHRHGLVSRPLTPPVPPVDTPVPPVDTPVPPVDTPVPPVDTSPIYPDSGRRVEGRSIEGVHFHVAEATCPGIMERITDGVTENKTSTGRPRQQTGANAVLQKIEELWGQPVVNWGKEAKPIKAALGRGYTPQQIVAGWQASQDSLRWRGQWIPLTYLMEDLGEFLKTGTARKWGARNEPKRAPRRVEAHRDPADFARGFWEDGT